MALSKSMKVTLAVVTVLFIFAVGLGVGLNSGNTRTGIWLEFSPKPTAGDSLISFKTRTSDEYKAWVDNIDDFLKEYKTLGTKSSVSNAYICDFDSPQKNGSFCVVDMRSFGPCSPENSYGYPRAQPCVFLSPNKMLNWVPEPYQMDSLPWNMTADLKKYINNSTHKNMIWVTCDGETPADRELIGSILYYPSRGFPAYFYPYTGTDGYLSPLVAVQFLRPSTGVVISVECKMWAKNVPYDRELQTGSTRFQLLVDQ